MRIPGSCHVVVKEKQSPGDPCMAGAEVSAWCWSGPQFPRWEVGHIITTSGSGRVLSGDRFHFICGNKPLCDFVSFRTMSIILTVYLFYLPSRKLLVLWVF